MTVRQRRYTVDNYKVKGFSSRKPRFSRQTIGLDSRVTFDKRLSSLLMAP